MRKPRAQWWIAAVVTLAASVVATAMPADAQYRRVLPRFSELPPTEARGCYFERGREFCGSYCYWEVNGKRYCQRRLRDAHSQAPVVADEYAVEDSYTLK